MNFDARASRQTPLCELFSHNRKSVQWWERKHSRGGYWSSLLKVQCYLSVRERRGGRGGGDCRLTYARIPTRSRHHATLPLRCSRLITQIATAGKTPYETSYVATFSRIWYSFFTKATSVFAWSLLNKFCELWNIHIGRTMVLGNLKNEIPWNFLGVPNKI